MDILFRDKKMAERCMNHSLSQKVYGKVGAKRLRQRLDDLRAASTLEDMRHLPGRCHVLKGDRAGVLSIDLEHPYRLLFVPAHNPTPRKEDGGLDWSKITVLEIIGVEDTHG